ncbi:GGDEF domain-containing protein [Limosilactobacillus sp. STM2_1]|uniref:GGDEF domain-containing protein n=2 Tax=Limosilactobacillus rudii TaxID=2759755 RepID=A0A7W3YMK6_9LACO|nr:GGDEF domain-containing protein [Limosilactobacillus rudii]MBB1097559.1 GGDEF domain-containing protein [Limosilactobacillus rudii]
MIISQIYFEHYWGSYKSNRLANFVLTAIITVTYFFQEFCLLQLSWINIGEAAFMQVVSITMIFRNRSNWLWWWLLILTPLFTNIVEVMMGLQTWNTWWIWLGEALTFGVLCTILTHGDASTLHIRYVLAIIILGVIKLVTLKIENQLTLVKVLAPTVGLLVILCSEGQRYRSEIKNNLRIKQLQTKIERDDLTGLLNYRALSEKIKELTENDAIHDIVIGGLDIDHFKRINDTYGHFVGNKVLNYFSTVLRREIHQAFPNHGYVYRFGGEEFSIVVSNHSILEVYTLLQSIEDYFAKKPIVTKEGIKITISFSCSLTNRLNGETLEHTLKRADKMLYSVKKDGRGWIITDQQYKSMNK